MKKVILLAALCRSFVLWAQIPAGYYDDASGLTGYKLKAALSHIISNQTISWNYGDLPGFYEITDRDLYYENDGSMLDIYSENPAGPDPYNYYYEDYSLVSGAANEGEGWNREHCFSQSFFYSNYPMYSDLHFIVPTDARVNQKRSNYPYSEVSDPSFISLNGGRYGLSAYPGYSLTSFEVIDEFKGDVARMLLYVAVRYERLLPFFQYTNQRNPFEQRQEVALRSWLIPMLKQWHAQDPVSQRELDRNNHIYEIQGNRNPFIDHPEWVNEIWSQDTPVVQTPEAPIYPQVVRKGKHFVTISWDVNPNDASMGFEVYRNDTFAEVAKQMNYTFTGLQPNTTYNFSVKSYDPYYNSGPASATLSVTTAGSDTFATDLYFTKYIEGTGNNNALEIYNRTGHTVDLRHYYIGIRQYNSDADVLYWTDNKYQMEGELEHGRKVVLIHPEWNLECFTRDSADFITAGTPLTFNGRLALDLRHDSFSVDRIGDPASYDSFAVQVSMYRNENVDQPTIAFDMDNWTVYPVNYCEALGNPAAPVDTDTVVSVLPVREDAFRFYPNPVQQGVLYAGGEGLQNIRQLVIFDRYGRICVQEHKPFAGKNYINLGHLRDGIYYLVVDGDGYKIVIRRE